jgi:2-furoate---CoA ligase
MYDLGRAFVASLERAPDSLAIVDGDTRLTYRQWHARICAAAGGLDALGLVPGDHLVTVLQNRWEAATLHWACQFLGLVITPLNWRMTGPELDYCLADARAKALVYQDASADAVATAENAGGIPAFSIDAAGGDASFAAILNADPIDGTTRADPDDISLMLYTSGTTGRPKGVPRTHRAELVAAVTSVGHNGFVPGERILGVMPFYHTMGVRSLLTAAVLNGALYCQPRFDAGRILGLIERERISALFLVPTLYHDIVSHADFSGSDISSARKLGFAGAPMPDGLLHRLQDAFKPDIFVNHYGSSEIYTFSIERNAAAKPGSAGKPGINQRMRVAKLGSTDPDDVADVGEEGQLIADMSGEEAFAGYWQRPDADAKTLHDGWYFTGDTGYVDADGDFFVTGRVDDMMISGGENVSPVEIESVLSLHPAVSEVAVVGLADARWGQKITAFVSRLEEVAAEDLDAHCQASELANFKRPREYVFVKSVPKSPVGKILRRMLVAGDYEAE